VNIRFEKKGFTLVELLVAMAVVATVVSMVYGSYVAASKSAGAYNARIAASRQQQALLRQLSRQLRSCFVGPASEQIPRKSLVSGNAEAGRSGTRKADQVPEKKTDYFSGGCDDTGGRFLHFVSTSKILPQPGVPEGLFEMTYRFDRAAGTIYANQRIFAARSANHKEQLNWQGVADGVRDLKIWFFDGKQWLKSYSYLDKKGLPLAVRIEITVEDKNHRRLTYQTTALISCRKSQSKIARPQITSGISL